MTIRVCGMVCFFISLLPCIIYGQGIDVNQAKSEPTIVKFDAPIPKSMVLKVQNQNKSDVSFDRSVLRAKSVVTVEMNFPTTIVFSDELLAAPSAEIVGNALVLATTAFERMSEQEMLETDHMRNVASKIGLPKGLDVRFGTLPARNDGKQRIKVNTTVKNGNLRLLHIKPEIWRLEGESWVLEDKGALASMSL